MSTETAFLLVGISILSLVVTNWLVRWRFRDLEDRVFDLEIKDQPPTVEVLEGELTRETDDAMCWDIQSPVNVLIPVGGQVVITTNLKTRMWGCDALILSRSGMSAKHRVSHRAGVIDEKYPERWGIVLVNEGRSPYQIQVGDRIAQVLFMPKSEIEVKAVSPHAHVRDGGILRTGGFGSTGK